MQTTFIKTQEAQITGQYVATTIDQRKANADFRLIDMTRIVWKDGRQQDVTKRQLAKLQASHSNWMADF